MNKYCLSLLLLTPLTFLPLYSNKLIFKCADNGEFRYGVERIWSEPKYAGPFIVHEGRHKFFNLTSGETLELELNPEDVVQIFIYARERSPFVTFYRKSLGKKFKVGNLGGNTILINENGFIVE